MFGELLNGLKNKLGDVLGNAGIDTELIMQHIKKGAKTAGRETTKIGLELYQVMKAKDTPMMDKTIIGAALAYQFLPNDLISTKNFGAIGALDNAIAIGVAYNRMKKHITPEIQASVKTQLDEWFGVEVPVAEPAKIPAEVSTPENV